jgi:hypothetical protein
MSSSPSQAPPNVLGVQAFKAESSSSDRPAATPCSSPYIYLSSLTTPPIPRPKPHPTQCQTAPPPHLIKQRQGCTKALLQASLEVSHSLGCKCGTAALPVLLEAVLLYSQVRVRPVAGVALLGVLLVITLVDPADCKAGHKVAQEVLFKVLIQDGSSKICTDVEQ